MKISQNSSRFEPPAAAFALVGAVFPHKFAGMGSVSGWDSFRRASSISLEIIYANIRV